MKVTHLQTSFTEQDLILNSPFVAGLHKLRFEGGNFYETMLGYHQDIVSVPFYEFTKQESEKLAYACELTYDALFDAVGLLLSIDVGLISKYFGEEFISRYPQFVEYAKHTYRRQDPAIYGRFDIAYDPSGLIKFYEFNGDTPTMLFESSCINHVMLEKVGMTDYQLNEWQEYFIHNIPFIVKPGQTMAVVAKMDITTDAMTAEYIYNTALQAGVNAILMDFSDLEYDVIDKLFHYNGTVVNAVYILKPWEEMVEESPHIIADWPHWSNECIFFEPAWRWFTSNKGIWAYVYDLMTGYRTHDLIQSYRTKHQDVLQYLLPTYMESDKPSYLTSYVAKPIIGRCSQSVRVYQNNQLMLDTSGWYSGMDAIVQQWCPAPSLPDRNQFVTCMWMAPYGYDNDKATMTASVVTVRECKGDITDIRNEAVYPCIVR